MVSCAAACLCLPASADEGIDIRFDGDRLITNPDEEKRTGKPLILQGEVEKGEAQAGSVSAPRFSAPPRTWASWPTPAVSPIPRLRGVAEDSQAGQGASSPLMLRGEVSTSVPKTPDDVASYLRKMRALIKNYQAAAMSDIFHGGTKADMANMDVGQLQGETTAMIGSIMAIVPPAELKSEHEGLAEALSAVRTLLVPQGGGGFNPLSVLDRMGPVMSYCNRAMTRYHEGVLNVISQYGLSNSLDPLGDERQSDNQLLENAFADLSNQLLSKEKAAYGQQSSGDGGAALSNMLGASAGDLQGLRSLMGGSGGSMQTFAKILGGSAGGGGIAGSLGSASSAGSLAGMLNSFGSGQSGSGLNAAAVEKMMSGLTGADSGDSGGAGLGGLLGGGDSGD